MCLTKAFSHSFEHVASHPRVLAGVIGNPKASAVHVVKQCGLKNFAMTHSGNLLDPSVLMQMVIVIRSLLCF